MMPMTQMIRIILIFFVVLLVGCGANATVDEEVAVIETAVPPPTSTTEPVPSTEPTKIIAAEIETAVPTPDPTATTAPTALPATSGVADADVLFVKAEEKSANVWTFSVTVAHPDTGWEDYADGWDVLLPDGSVIFPDANSPFTRLLVHPHVNEQPFTRSQANIEIPAEVTAVTVRAHDLLDGFGGQEITVDLTQPTGENQEVQRYGE